MFNNWLKRRDNESDVQEDELIEDTNQEVEETGVVPKDTNVVTNNLDYDDSDDDYYYYYYYDDDTRKSNEPTIPDLNLEKDELLGNDTLSELYDSEQDVYTSPYEEDELNVSDVPVEEDILKAYDDLVYESDAFEETPVETPTYSEQFTLLENENEQLRSKLDRLLIENDELKVETTDLERLVENNSQLTSQLEEYGTLMEENQNLQIQLLDFNRVPKENDTLINQTETLKADLIDKENKIDDLVEQVGKNDDSVIEENKSLTEKLEELANKLVEKENQLADVSNQLVGATSLVSQKEEAVSELEQQLIDTTKNNASENDSLVKELEKAKAEESVLRESLDQISKERQVELTSYNETKQYLDKLSTELKEKEIKISELTTTIESKEQDLAGLIEENKQLIETVESLTHSIEEHSDQEKEQLKLDELNRELDELGTQLAHSKELETELTKKYEQELAELRENQKTINTLEKELMDMKAQQERVTTGLTELSAQKSKADSLAMEVETLKNNQNPDVFALQAELTRVKEELRHANMRAEQSGTMNQSDIAQVMLEAQAKARQIVDVANYEAKRRVADAEMELSAVSQEARNYYRKLEKTKAESEVVFGELLRKLESIGDIDRI